MARRRLVWCLLVLGVLLAHVWLLLRLPQSRIGEGSSDAPPKPMDIEFVRELVPSVPPQPRAPPAAAAAPAPPPPVAQSASEPLPPVAETPPSAPVEVVLAEPPLPASSPAPVVTSLSDAEVAALAASVNQSASVSSLPALSASAPAVQPTTPASETATQAFDWPPSTRLSYRLTGQYRGPLYGSAQVEWMRQGSRYQVRVDVKVPPLFERRMISEGLIGPDGLTPRRYDQETEILFQGLRRETVRLGENEIQLANGRRGGRTPGLQDPASQFVQMTWLFLTRTEPVKVGQLVSFPVALPRRVGRWNYLVKEYLPIELPLGTVEVYHVQPLPQTLQPNELSVEMWVAPSLQYLPVRIQIRQDDETFLLLDLAQLPLQAAAASPAASAASQGEP